jgi:hypothetical protein
MKFGIGVICKTSCSKFEFLEYLHRKIVLMEGRERIYTSSLRVRSRWHSGRRSARNAVQHLRFVKMCAGKEGRAYVVGVSARTRTVYCGTCDVRTDRQTDRQTVRQIADGAVCTCRLPQSIQTVSGALPAVRTIDSRGSSPGAKRPGREANHSLPLSTKVKN